MPLSGFEGVDGLDNVYADIDEYNIIHSDDVDGLGEIASGTALATATSAVAAISAALKGLFSKGGSEAQAFQSETHNADTASSMPATIPESEDAIVDDEPVQTTTSTTRTTTAPSTAPKTTQLFSPSSMSPYEQTPLHLRLQLVSQYYQVNLPQTEVCLQQLKMHQPALLFRLRMLLRKKEGFLQKTTAWVKENPGKSLLVAGGSITGGYLLMNGFRGGE